MKFPCTGVILAGGLNTRLPGRAKAFLNIGGVMNIQHIYELFKELFEEIILVTNSPLEYLEWDLNIVTDLLPVRSSLTGIYSGLFYTTNPYAFVVACDTPFLKKEVLEVVLEGIESGIDVVIPETSKGMEPLCAAYSKKCLEPVKQQLVQREFKIQRFFKKIRFVSKQFLRTFYEKKILNFYLFLISTRLINWK
ncbi:MAG: molybdenum cofactor guanylyltransferase [Deltaproteobacteria bacterium]|nr:molybdenum cofactor guanylyltransferase [Deltaproteobacteria bacterium]